MFNVRLVVEYNGHGFHGWQKQPNLRTVQSELERAISIVLHTPVSPLHAAGRTDSGVHAKGQVVCFFVDQEPDLWRLSQGVSHILHPELSVVQADIVSHGFHPRRSAVFKTYQYSILTRPAPPVLERGQIWHVPRKFDHQLLQDCAETIVGTHDFTSFQAADCSALSPIKEIHRSTWTFDSDRMLYTVVGQGFLKQMVRILVGTMIELATGRITERTMNDILLAKDRLVAGITAPPFGLLLHSVEYDRTKLQELK
jgi:tRNA pseudouridine38-40 synthase